MKNIFKLTTLSLLLGGMVFTTSCGDAFLEEVKRDQASSDLLNTPEGLASMANALYQEFNYFFVNESSYTYTNYGTDEFMVAGDNSNEMWNNYDSRLKSTIPAVNSNTQGPATFWDTLYSWISRCNTIIFRGEESGVLEGSALAQEALGTAYFVRGFNYLFLVQQYGALPLNVEAVTSPQREYTRNSPEEVAAQIISDLEKAHGMLTSDASKATSNYITKYAAAHYLAKAHLWRASEINDSWNGSYKSADLSAVIKYADEVIAAHPLVNEFNDLFNNFTGYDTSITETNSEIVLSSGASDASTVLRKGHMGLANFTAWYQGFFLMERDIPGAREYQRTKTTPKYAYYLYDLENDSRFWKSFKTTYAVNNNTKTKTYKVDGKEETMSEYFPSNAGEYLAAMYVINREDYGVEYYASEVNTQKDVSNPSFTRTDYVTGKKIPTIMALNIYDGKGGKRVGTSLTPDFATLYAPL